MPEAPTVRGKPRGRNGGRKPKAVTGENATHVLKLYLTEQDKDTLQRLAEAAQMKSPQDWLRAQIAAQSAFNASSAA